MEIIDSLFSDKKTVIIMAIAYVIVMVVALIIIWKPNAVLEISKYEPYVEEQMKEKMASYYFGSVQDIGVYNAKSYLSSILSESYLEFTNQSIDEVMGRMRTENKYPTVTNVQVHNIQDKYIYTGNLIVNSNIIPVCIIENYPYDIKLTFDNFLDYYTINRTTSKNGITITLKDVYKNLNYVEYSLEIQNESAEYVTMEFSVASNVYITLNNSQIVYLNNAYDSAELKKLEINNIANRDIVFNIPFADQDKIQSINFKNVIIDGKTVELEIVL